MAKHIRIRITAPSITKKEIRFVTRAVADGWGQKAFYYIKKFESAFAKHIGVTYAIATSSCTGALHIALQSLGITAGDEVILPESTWAGSAFPVAYVGAKPVFADILEDSWCIDPENVKKHVTKATKAIIPVHLYGHPADMEKILRIAKAKNLYIIEDAAQSFGATYKGKHTGTFGDFAAFSFHGTKSITTGEGGMLVTNNRKLYERAYFLANQAKDTRRLFWNTDIGLKYKMTNMQAALGLAQLSRSNLLLRKKRQIFSWYAKHLSPFKQITLNTQKPHCTNSYWMPTIMWDKSLNKSKEYMMAKLKKRNIDPRPFFYPLSSMPPFKQRVHNPVALDISSRAINLPCGYSLTKKDAVYVADSVIDILELRR